MGVFFLLIDGAIFYAWVAQSVEQRTENPCVGGSIPPPGTTYCFNSFCPNNLSVR
jgi:hypothetical protein